MSDLQWMWSNFMKQDSFPETGLDMAANMFQYQSPKDVRKKVLLVLLHGPIEDDARLASTLAKLKDLGVELVGIVMREGDPYLQGDRDAEANLKPITNEPHQRYYGNWKLDDVETNLFNVWCNPTSPWGTWLVADAHAKHQPCPFHTKAQCNKDRIFTCEWN